MPFKTENRKRNKQYIQVNTEVNSSNDEKDSWKFWKKKRYVLSILGFFGFANVFALRAILSVAIVDMTSIKNFTLENGTIIQKREFEWDSTIQGYVLSSFYYGYIATQIVGGYLAVKFGGAKVFGAGIATTAIFTLLTPLVAKTNISLFIALRAAEGFFEGVNYPALLSFWAKWAPPLEKTRLVTIAISGTYFGTLIAMPVSSLLATAFGWESIFYVFGGVALFWFMFWVILVRESPSDDTRISPEERKYIIESINATKTNEVTVVPWFSMLSSKVVLALCLILSCETWGFHTMATFLPQMMKSALNFDLNKSGFLSALPYIAMCFSIQIGGQISDWLLRKKYMSTTVVRKLTVTIGFVSQATFLLCAAIWISPLTTPIFLILGATFGGVALSGLMIIPLDIAPNFSSIIYGINNTFGTIPGIVSPILTGYLVRDLTNVDQWRIIYYISSGIYLVGAVTSIIFISGEVQPWAKINETEDINKKSTELGIKNDKEEDSLKDI